MCCMLFTAEWGTSFTTFGLTQHAFFSVTVIESLISSPNLIAQRRDAACVQDSPRQSQWVQMILSLSFEIIHGVGGF